MIEQGSTYVAPDERPLKDLVKQLGSDASLLIRQEMQLARNEVEDKIKDAGRDGIVLTIGGAVAYAGLLAISAGIILVLANWMAAWLAALIVGALLVVGGAVLLFLGKVGFQRLDPVPRETVRSLRADLSTIQHAAR